MREINKWLQENPLITITMFFIGSTSGIATLVLGWPQLYKDYLSKSIEIPVWLIFLLFLLMPAVAIFYRRFQNPEKTTGITKIEGRKFGVERVFLDGKSFERCEFDGTELIFEGIRPFSIKKCNLSSPRITFSNHADLTLNLLSILYSDAGFKPIIETTLNNIRTGKFKIATPPSR